MALKTDYKDDVPVSERRKYQMVDNGDGTVSFVDVTKYSQEGDTFGAADINATNEAVNEKFDSGDVVDPMETTESGFAADALAVKNQFDEQNKNLEWKLKGTVTGTAQIDLSDISFKELLIEVQYEGYSDCYTFYIISNLLTITSHKPFNQGYHYTSTNFGLCQIFASLNSIYLGNFIHISKESKEKAVMKVFYR